MANNTPPNTPTGEDGDRHNDSDSQEETLIKPKTGTGNPNNFCQPGHTENDALESQNQNDQEEKNPSNSPPTYNDAPTIEPKQEEVGSNDLEGVGAHFEQGDERPENFESGLYEEEVEDDTQESRQNNERGEDGMDEVDDTPEVRGSRGHPNHRLEGEAALLSTDRVLMEPLALILLDRLFREEDERQAETASGVDRNNRESAANSSLSEEDEEGNQDGHGEGDGDGDRDEDDGDYQEDTGYRESDDTEEAEDTGEGDDSGDEDDNGDDDDAGDDDAEGEDDTIDNTNVNSGHSSCTQPSPEDHLLPELEPTSPASESKIASISDSRPSHSPAPASPEDAVSLSTEKASADHPANSSTDDKSPFVPPSGFAGAHDPSQSSVNAPGPSSSGNTSADPSGSSSTMTESQPALPFTHRPPTPTEDLSWAPNPNNFGINRRRCPMCVCRARGYVGACVGGPPCDACAKLGYSAEECLCQSGGDGEGGGGRHERPGRKGRK